MWVLLWFIIVFVVAVLTWPAIWASQIRNKVECTVDFSRHECNIGEALPITVTLINRAWFPLPLIQVQVKLPAELSVAPDVPNQHLSFRTYLLMRRRVQMQFTLYGFARGPATIRNIYVRMHEGLGLRNVYIYDQSSALVAVRPDPARELPPALNLTLQGERPYDQWLFPDETMFKGVRNYQFGDPARHIHWRASARLGHFVSKQFFSSTSKEVLLLLNAQTVDPFWLGTHAVAFEQMCREVTATALHLEKQGARLVFATNTVILDGGGNWQNRLVRQLNTPSLRSLLAHANKLASAPLTSMLAHILQHHRKLPPHIILFSAFETPKQAQMLERLQKLGMHLDIIRPKLEQATDTDVNPAAPMHEPAISQGG
ncbi:DUF58 domain-containing protein [Alicyclobacillus fodiniaquatilis]|uniref:DUF58 domain-containing protein n=1 Tax=Alicyclobacillus fodiniaquatilis TaxID=1661150 RepID=A0ABW4JLW4_9BACL